jgi:hypothetical protein
MPTEVVGLVALKKALNQYAPDLAKELTRELNAILKPIVNEARGFVPSQSPISGWERKPTTRGFYFPKYDAAEIRRGIIYKTTPSRVNQHGFKNTIRIQNKSKIGAIYETAGRLNGQGQEWVGPKGGGSGHGVSRSVNPYAGNQFISNLGNLYGSGKKDSKMMGRLIFRAWAKTQGKANAKVFKAIENSTDRFNKRTQIVDVKRAA